ncbi:MAG: flagellar hook-associated protein FlgK [Spirochaetaceae bacterium]|nr:flagellar hook-associated protein FlgK [Spirochaetaceae bacterium]MCF7948818.1 flagellar hook-associated protein FlgK [Spirochaetia bacterium]MCF7950451.1 flagellar hook-associated protein FlgK [Spirochaetaceae bacterium]
MNSTFAGIEMGKRSLVTHTTAMSTIGHNLGNAAKDGYSRQRVEMKAFDPIYMPGLNREETAGQLGQGVTADKIERIHDEILEGRIVKQANGEGYWKTRDKYVLMMEQVYNEPGDISVRAQMDQFWDSWQELSMYPEQTSARHSVLERGKSLINGIHRRYEGLTDIRDMLEQEVQGTVQRINSTLAEVSEINKQIVKIEAMGDNPNDLLDQRDRLVNRLSSLVDISVSGRDPDEFTIHSGGMHLLQGRVAHFLSAEPNTQNEGYSDVVWRESGEEFLPRGGELAGYLELRDEDVREEIQGLDMMTINFTDMVNSIHRDAYGKNGKTNQDFFTEWPFVNNVSGNYDRNGDGEFDSTYLFRITGSNSLDPQQQIGLEGTISLSGPQGNVEIDYNSTDTVEELVSRINTSGAEVVARLDRNGRLNLKASPAAEVENPDFVIRHIEDSGQFLSGYSGVLTETGAVGAYDWEQADAVTALRGEGVDYSVAPLSHPAGWTELNPAIANDPESIAAGFGKNGEVADSGSGDAALAIAQLRNGDVMVGKYKGFSDYFSQAVTKVGLKGEAADRAYETEQEIMQELKGLKDSISGVNIDEELSQMIKFQHGYAAASRYISQVNQMLDTIINRMGV